MRNKYLYCVRFTFIDDPDIFSDNHLKFKYYHYDSLDSIFFDLRYDLKKDFQNCIEMLVSKNG